MNVRIRKMSIENFKGIKNLEIRFDGQNAVIYGDNATGKTSLFDAFLWLLFGKDSSDRSDFGVKPYDANGQEIHNLETVVEAELEIDGLKVATLKHLLKENWVKKNGQSEQVFSGNQHKYWINGISHSASDYEKFVVGIAPKKIFPLITNPMAFNALKWQDRRDVLLKLCPVDVDSILLTRPEYIGIAEEIVQRGTGIYGLKKLKREQKSRDDKEIEQIPVRIAELQRLTDPDMERKYYAFSPHAEKEVPDYLSGLQIHEHFAHGFGWKELPDNYKVLFSELWHPETYRTGIIRQAGWLFDLREFFKEYWVEDEVAGIRKIYAPCRGAIRQMSSYPHHILRIIEIKKNPQKKVSA